MNNRNSDGSRTSAADRSGETPRVSGDVEAGATVYGNTVRGRHLVAQLQSLGALLARRPDLVGVGVAARHQLVVGAA